MIPHTAPVLALNAGRFGNVVDMAMSQQKVGYPVVSSGQPFSRPLRGINEDSSFRGGKKKAIRIEQAAGISVYVHANRANFGKMPSLASLF